MPVELAKHETYNRQPNKPYLPCDFLQIYQMSMPKCGTAWLLSSLTDVSVGSWLNMYVVAEIKDCAAGFADVAVFILCCKF